jgi:hypothetical protein
VASVLAPPRASTVFERASELACRRAERAGRRTSQLLDQAGQRGAPFVVGAGRTRRQRRRHEVRRGRDGLALRVLVCGT